jgi:hypothetical protein
MRRRWRVLVGIALVATAALLAFEAHALVAAHAANERDAARGLLILSGADPKLVAPSTIGSRERTLLGLDGLPALHRALNEIGRSRAAKKSAARTRAMDRAEQILEHVAASDAPAARRSQAANLLAALVLIEGLSHQNPDEVNKATGIFRHAIALDPSNESAKFNLELVLSMPPNKGHASDKSQAGSTSGTGHDEAGSGY